jgi:hypothetical protein
MLGVSPTSGERINVADVYKAAGTRFGSAFDRNQIQLSHWGRLDLELGACLSGTLRYQSDVGQGSGTLAPVRLTVPAGAVCLEGTPAVPASATWGQVEPMTLANSERRRSRWGTRCISPGDSAAPTRCSATTS